MVKTLQKFSSPELQVDFHETWYVALETPAHNVFLNDDPVVTLTFFTAMSNLVIKAFLWENGKTVHI